MSKRTLAIASFAVCIAVLATMSAAWSQQIITTTSRPGVGMVGVQIAPAPPLYYVLPPIAVSPLPPYPGQWVWDPIAGVWYWQVIIPPPIIYYYPYFPAHPYYYGAPPAPGGAWSFTPNPEFEKGLFGMFYPAPKPEPPFPPGASPTFPWSRNMPSPPVASRTIITPPAAAPRPQQNPSTGAGTGSPAPPAAPGD